MKSTQIIWKTPFTLLDLKERCKSTLSEYLNIEFTEIGDNYLVATMEVDHRTLQPLGSLHGGASCALAETVASIAANYCVDPNHEACVGLDINMNHIRQVRSGKVKAITTPLHLGKTTQVWEIKIYSKEEKLVSAGRLTIAILQTKKNPGFSTRASSD